MPMRTSLAAPGWSARIQRPRSSVIAASSAAVTCPAASSRRSCGTPRRSSSPSMRSRSPRTRATVHDSRPSSAMRCSQRCATVPTSRSVSPAQLNSIATGVSRTSGGSGAAGSSTRTRRAAGRIQRRSALAPAPAPSRRGAGGDGSRAAPPRCSRATSQDFPRSERTDGARIAGPSFPFASTPTRARRCSRCSARVAAT